MKVGLIPLAAKPYHAGHDRLIRIAAEENDVVKLFVSISDRARPGEIVVSGSKMLLVWSQYVEKTLPKNVTIAYSKTPILDVYKNLESAESENLDNIYSIYSDEKDILRYDRKHLLKSAPRLFSTQKIILKGIKRTDTIDVSGTKMRTLLKEKNVPSFINFLPSKIQKHGKKIFDLLVEN